VAAKPLAHGVALALAVLLEDLDVPRVLVGVAHAFAFGKGVVAGIAFDEQDFLRRAESRHAPDRIFDIAALVPAGNQDAGGKPPIRELANRTPDQIGPQA